MSELPPEQERLIQQIADPPGTHGREAARAKLDALLARELTASLGQLSGELVQTRQQMADSSLAASTHQRALVVWTAVLSFATMAYAVAAFLPLFWRSPALSASAGRAWVLWMESPVHSKQWTLRYPYDPPAFETKRECDQAAQHAEALQTTAVDDATKRGLPVEPGSWYVCLPDTVDPRRPKGK